MAGEGRARALPEEGDPCVNDNENRDGKSVVVDFAT
jgi:hypothetical protein